MPIEYRKKLAVFQDIVSVEEADGLLNWLSKRPDGRADLSACSHLHPANLQVLLAGSVKVTAWPQDTHLALWLRSVLRGVN